MGRRGSRAGVRRPALVRARSAGARALLGASVVCALVAGLPGTAAAVPPPPPNPSDAEIESGNARVSEGVSQVGDLINQVATANQQLAQLDDEVAIKREDVNKALVDLQTARDEAAAAGAQVEQSQQALRDAGTQIEQARKRFTDYAVSSYTKGRNVASLSSFFGADGPEDILDRAQMMRMLSASQKAILENLERARTEQANRDSAAREAKQRADAAAGAAENKKAEAEQAIAAARNALQEQAARKAQIESQRDGAQAQLDAARANVTGLQGQRDAYLEWDNQRRAEEAAAAAAAAAAAEAARRAAADQASRERASQVADSERPHTQIDDDGEWSAPAQSAPKPMAPSVTGAGAIETVIDRGMSQLGLPYAWGGGNANGPTLGIRDGGVADSYGDFNKVGFDCSGLMIYAFAGIGISLPHYTGYQYTAGTQVPSSQMRRGDMIFWGPGASQHVALYLGDGQMLEAPQSGSTVRVSPVRWDGMTPYAVRMVS
ncbi:NlpC/P60 family protein [Rhodococcus hoagii]|uniref:NlpC/P60 family protein n=6 Tax=Rhodococcus hoagii TaxID=43767 RepID=A0A9Q2UKC9_RHOHA|nr:NlpC/P60 family protein [Prescottella equi]CBH48295.1 putative secreted protein [Prescottella equi 103S]MBM4499599.1 NlpC/P60 family protein [Prescottella equi]MBM4503541.1 NlpC/P60 family protein [Prescottella equi]MBM4515180.1 NlpC/P60 family protein [Prescottella equi]